ncbi:MAG: SRPBCC family protein [Rhizobiaceae bacterium]
MRKFILWVLGIIVVAVAGLFAYASTLPDSFRIERSASYTAAPQTVFAVLSDFNKSAEWSPWEKLDPQMERKISGAPSGVGAIYEWKGNKDVGSGRQEIIEATSPSLVRVKLDFNEPMQTTNTVDYVIEPEGTGTKLTWAMYGPQPLIARVFSIFMDIDGMVGGDFEKGLANLKPVVEGQ